MHGAGSILASLAADHDRLRTIADRLEHYFDQPIAPVDIEFSRLRWMLIRELSVHLARDRAMFGSTGRRGPTGHLAHRFDEYVATWTARAIQRQWSRYAQASRLLLRQLRDCLRREEGQLLPRPPAAALGA